MKKRITKVNIHGDEFMDVDYDDELRSLKGLSDKEVIESLSETFFWVVALPHIENDTAFTDLFLREFSKCKDARDKAVFGNSIVDSSDELGLLNAQLRMTNKGSSDKRLNQSQRLTGVLFADFIKEKDYKGLERLARIKKDGGVKQGGRGGIEGSRGKLFSSFCRCFLTLERLPTKKEVRHGAGLFSNEGDERLDADRAMRKIGLGKLKPS